MAAESEEFASWQCWLSFLAALQDIWCLSLLEVLQSWLRAPGSGVWVLGPHPALPAAIVSPGCAPGGWMSWASPAERGFISLMLTQKPGNKEKPLK